MRAGYIIRRSLFFVLILFGILAGQAQSAHWEWQNPLPTGNGLADVWRSGSEIFAVGSFGTILHYSGSSWETMDSGTFEDLYGVWGSAVDNVFAVGKNGTILRFNGTSWSAMTSNTAAYLNDVWGSSATDVWAVGTSGYLVHYDGLTWTETQYGTYPYPEFRGIWGSSASNVYVVGSSETILHYNGEVWNDESPGITSNFLRSVWGDGSGTVFAVGASGTVLTYIVGVGWQGGENIGGTLQTLENVWGSSASDVFVIGYGGTILHFDGLGWALQTTGTTYTLEGIDGISSSDVLVAGAGGTLLRYNGSAWSFESSNVAAVTLTDIWGSTADTVFAVGYSGTILQYNGSSWTAMTSNTTENLSGVWGSSGSNVFAVGSAGTILQYNGSSWSVMTSNTTAFLNGIWGSGAGDVFAVGNSATILHYDGSTWTAMTSNTFEELYDVWGSSGSDVYAIGYGGTILHYDGSAWSQTESLGYDVESIWGTSATDVYLLDSNGLYHFDGYIWTQVAITFYSPNNIWGDSTDNIFIVGSYGTIVHYARQAYYVDMTRPDDSGDGTSTGTAWKTIHHAVDQINAMPAGNYRLSVAPGTYSVSNGEADAALTISHDNVSLQGTGAVILDGEQFLGVESWMNGISVEAAEVALRGLQIKDFSEVEGGTGIGTGGGDTVLVENCEISGSGYAGITGYGKGMTVVACNIHDNDGYGIFTSSTDFDIRRNRIYDNSGIGIYSYATQDYSYGRIINNLIYQTSPASSGIGVDAYGGTGNYADIYHNTIHNVESGIWIYQRPGETVAPDIRFNIIGSNTTGGTGILFDDPAPGGFSGTIDFNDVWNSALNYSASLTAGTNDISADPLYVDTGLSDFHLQSGSPCIDAIPTGAGDVVLFDLDSVARPQGGGFDMGAYETQQEPSIQYTLTVSTVGQGSVTLNPTGGTYDADTEVSLTAIAVEGWKFAGWSGALGGSANPTIIAMTADKTVTATFVEKSAPEQPIPDSPADESTIAEGDPVTLDASDFSDPDAGDSHVQTYWQVSRADSGELIYDEVSSVYLTQFTLPGTLAAGLKYTWRVGYEDSDGNIAWSDEYSFKVGTSVPESLPEVAAGSTLVDYGMISIVHWPDDPSPGKVFNIQYDPRYYRIGTYDPASGGYIEFGDGLEIEPGRSYWMLAREGLSINFNGIPVSLLTDIDVGLKFNPDTQNGWNMIACPNEANYNWNDVQVVSGGVAYAMSDPTASTLIDTRLWQWENGAYASYLPSDNFTMEKYKGYWVKAKIAGVYLRFPATVLAGVLSEPSLLAKMKNGFLRYAKAVMPNLREAVAEDQDTPPMPMGALQEDSTENIFSGCFIEIARDFKWF